MKKDSVIVEGVILTREVLEKAIQELNTPIVQQPYGYPRTLRLKTRTDVEFVVPSTPVRRGVDKCDLFSEACAPEDHQTLICSKGNGSSGYTAGGAYRVYLPKLEVVL